jgi:hypothetical protein
MAGFLLINLVIDQSWANRPSNMIATIIATATGTIAIKIDGRTRSGRLSLSGLRNECFISYCSSDPTRTAAPTVVTASNIPVIVLI